MKRASTRIASDGSVLTLNKKIVQPHHRWYWQTILVAVSIILITFSAIPLLLTVVNSMKSAVEVQNNIFAFPKGNVFQNIAHNYKSAWEAVGSKFFPSVIVALIGGTGITFISAALAYILTFKDFYYKNVVFLFFISILLVPSIIGYPVLTPLVRDFLHLDGNYVGFLLPMIGGCQVGGMFLFKTFFGQQPKSLYESARIEGCSDVEIFFKVTIPLALPMILYHFVGSFCGVYNNFLWASLILSDSNMTIMYTMNAVADTFKNVNDGAAYAMYMISSIPLIITTIVSMKYFKSGEFAAGLKL